MRKAAKVVQQSLSVPRYTGVQQIIGVEGAPDLPELPQPTTSNPSTTQPTTAQSAAR